MELAMADGEERTLSFAKRLVEKLDQPEVSKLDIALRVKQYVCGLQIAVGPAQLVNMAQGLKELPQNPPALFVLHPRTR